MKKILLILLALMLTLVGFAWATYTTGQNTWGSTVTLTFTPSNNVYIDYAEGTSGISYTAGSYHQTGNRTFATSSGDTKIYYQEVTGMGIPTPPTAPGASANFSGWKEL